MPTNNNNDDFETNNSDLEEVSVSPEESEEGPPRRQHKYTTADLQPERPWKRYFLIFLCVLVIIVIMVLLSLFLQKLFDPDEDDDWDDSSDNANSTNADDDLAGIGGVLTGTSMLLSKTSDFIDDVCSRAKVSGTDEEQAACATACAPANDCCRKNSTCLANEMAGCVTYAPCQALDSLNDPPAADLDRLCSLESLKINREDCEVACGSLECCYQDRDSCQATQFWTCLDFAPCQNLRLPEGTAPEDSINFVGAAPASLDDQCRDGDGTCGRTCKEATCCSDPNSACYRDNFISCLTYATCTQLEDSTTNVSVEPANNLVPAAPDNLEDLCLLSQINGDAGSEACTTACAPAACCFEDGASGCFGTDPLGCLGYQICTNVQ